MEIINIIIDKVEDINIFNLVESQFPSRYLHYRTRMSKKFIDEFVNEVKKLNLFVLSMENLDFPSSLKVINKLKLISETFFVQFFPFEIIEKFRISEGGYLFLHVDSSLSHIPWELLYDGKSFLGDKFRIGRNIDGTWQESPIMDKTKLKILIIADPSMDLPEAEEEGTILFETLNTEINNEFLEIQMYSGDRITKLKLLSEIQDYDIVHYAGHVIFDHNDPGGGILLSNEEILYSKEIEKLPHAPFLVFLNACRSAIPESNIGLANSFLKAGVGNYIGTNWNIPDSQKTVEFAVNFYRYLFDEKSVGDALFEARKIARETHEIHELIWASYSLHGNPTVKVFRYPEKRSYDAIRTDWSLRKVFNEFPTFIAVPYRKFTEEKENFLYLIETYKHLIFSVCSIIIETYTKLNLKLSNIFENESNVQSNKNLERIFNLNDLLNYSYLCAKRLNLINIQIVLLPLIKSFLLHKEDMKKMLDLIQELEEKIKLDSSQKDLSKLYEKIPEEEIETFVVSFQYLLENLFVDFSIISKINFFYNNGVQFPSLLFKGQSEKSFHVLPIFKEDILLRKFLEEHIGEVCILFQNFYLSLHHFMEYEPISRQFRFKIRL